MSNETIVESAVAPAPAIFSAVLVPPSAVPAADRFARLWLWFLGAGALSIGIYQFLPDGLAADIGYVAVGLAGATAIVVGIRINLPARGWPWYLMAAGQFIWVGGDVAGSWATDVAHLDEFPSPADAFYLSAYPVLALGLLLLIRGRRLPGDRSGLLDSATVTVGLGMLSWVLLARPTISSYRDESVVSTAVAVAYPVGDILLLAMLVFFLANPGTWTTSARLLLAALALLIGADTATSALSLLSFGSTDHLDFLWMMSYVTWGAAALHPSMRVLSQPALPEPIRFNRIRLVAMTVAVLIAPGTLAVERLTGQHLEIWAVVLGSVAMFLLVVARMNASIAQLLAANQQRERLQSDLAHQAAHDSLTGLANRAQAMQLIRGALSRGQRTKESIGLLFIDLDGFKRINDDLGHAAGDEVLRAVAKRMQSDVRGGDTVARLGGDEFVVLLEPLDGQAAAVGVADRLVAAVSRPVLLAGGRVVRVGASVGVALSQPGVIDPEALLHEADVAVYRAKSTGRGHTEVFDFDLRRELDQRQRLEAAVATAIEDDELVVHYQPIVQVATGVVEGYEALVRWNRPGFGLLQPADFIPVAELSDLICAVDSWVLHRAMRQLAIWNVRSGPRELTMAVNISGRHIGRSRIRSDVKNALIAAGIDARQLVLEITETALIDDSQALVNMQDLRDLGVAISIDDFGTGYSSITRLETLPADIVKVDKRFLDRESDSSDKLLRLIVQAAHAFGLPVVAEGVETADQLRVLKEIGCESAQGHFLGWPADPGELTHMVHRKHA
jgi:diguanylate cyclase (GGDEF)-like protein